MNLHLNAALAAMLVAASLGGCQNWDYGEKRTAGAVPWVAWRGCAGIAARPRDQPHLHRGGGNADRRLPRQ